MTRLSVVEGTPFAFDAPTNHLVRLGAARLVETLRPRLTPFVDQGGSLQFQGVIGSLRLGPGLSLDIAPKVEPGEDWVGSVLDLLVGTSRLDVGAERRAGLSPDRRDLLDVLAAVYATRLEAALRRDGPLLILERVTARLPALKGRLRTTEWARSVLIKPTRFPVSFDELTSDNEYTRAMALAARMLANASTSPIIAARLTELARGLRPGAPGSFAVSPSVVHRPLPTNWSIYAPAWSVTVAILSRRALLGRVGERHGMEIVIEAWPLLETLLSRTLNAAVSMANSQGLGWRATRKGAQLLTKTFGDVKDRSVAPDGRLMQGEQSLATFEAKYARHGLVSDWPPREHVFQALSTAAACHSPVAVLVYPEEFDAVWWDVNGFNGRPTKLAAMGLGLFSYRRGAGDERLGNRVVTMLGTTGATGATQAA